MWSDPYRFISETDPDGELGITATSTILSADAQSLGVFGVGEDSHDCDLFFVFLLALARGNLDITFCCFPPVFL